MTGWLAFVESGAVIDLIIAITLVEASALLAWRRARAMPVVIGLVPGLCLMLALRETSSGGNAAAVALWLTLALPAHLFDLRLRLRS